MRTFACFDCGAPAKHRHHVVPKILGGKRTIPLCERCHGLVHSLDFTNHAVLTRAALLKRRSAGLANGGAAPFGYAIDDARRLVPNEAEQLVITRAKQLRADGLALRAIAAVLTKEGYVTRSGKQWHPTTLARIVGR